MSKLERAHSSAGAGNPSAFSHDPTAMPGRTTLTAALQAPVQRKAAAVGATAAGPGALPRMDLRPGAADAGAPLPDETLQKMERAFQTRFADVRIHVGEAAPAVGARAYAQGNHIYFAPGQYAPGTESGDALIAHELTHVVQQRAGRVQTPQGKGAPVNADPGLEAEADEVGDRVARGEPAGVAPASPGGESADGPIQRAVGFEFEFGAWRSTKDGGVRLAKGEAIETVAGAYQVQGEDVAGAADQSAVELVTEPAATLEEVRAIVGGAARKAQGYLAQPDPVAVGGVRITHGNQPVAQMQVSPAVALGAIPRLYGMAEPRTAASFLSRKVEETISTDGFRNKHLGGELMSDDLKGLLMLVVDYLRQGTSNATLNYPKEAIAMMARTTFTKMFSMLPEAERFGNERDQWTAMVLDVLQACSAHGAPLTNDPDRPALGQTFRDLDPVQPPETPLVGDGRLAASGPTAAAQSTATAPELMRLNVTRREWLTQMPDRDLLSNGADQRFEGMGKLGNATDLAEAAGAELGALALAMLEEQQRGEGAGDAEDAGPSSAPRPDKGEGKAEGGGEDAGRRPEAPLFELRGGNEMFGVAKQAPPDEWLSQAEQIFEKVHRANEGHVYRPGPAPLDRAPAPAMTNPHIWDRVPQPAQQPQQRRRPHATAPDRARTMSTIIKRLFCFA